MEAALLAFIRPYLFKLAVAGGLAIAAGGAFVSLKLHYTNQGYRRALDEIAADNKEAIDAADQARARVRDCRDAGGMWDAARGDCQRR